MIVIGNWKAYVESPKQAKVLFENAKKLAGKKGVQVVVAPPAPFLGLLAVGNRSKLACAAQDISTAAGGAATGETTAAIAQAAGATYAIIGHSERRARGETDAVVLEKVQQALAHNLTPILCIGESNRDADAHYLQFIRAQIHAVFSVLSSEQRARIILAYEPVWAIGKTAAEAINPHDLTEMILYIRKALGSYLSDEDIKKMTVIYGGSVDATNAKELLTGTGIDGFLPGRASTDPKEFTAIVQALF